MHAPPTSGATGARTAPWLPTPGQVALLSALLAPPGGPRLHQWASACEGQHLGSDLADLLPFAYRRLEQEAPEAAVTRASRDAYVATARANLLRMHRLLTAIRALDLAGIRSVVLKGAALLVRCYDGYGQRPMLDVDLLVERDDVHGALRVLQPLGWQTVGNASDRALRRRLRVDHALTLVADPRVYLDLHWSVADGVSAPATAQFMEAAEVVQHQDTAVRVPSPADLLVQSLIHAVQPAQQASCRWLVDTSTIIDGAGHALPWDRVQDWAAREHLTVRLREALSVLASFGQARVPEHLVWEPASTAQLRRERAELALFATLPPHPASRVLRWHWHRFIRLRKNDSAWTRRPAFMGFVEYLQVRWSLR